MAVRAALHPANPSLHNNKKGNDIYTTCKYNNLSFFSFLEGEGENET
jgi:hypothetical protein